ncbi:MAG: LCP family protein [Clostridia bacterium]|nr:LCP family protein [Clostridia bacterium]
MNLMKKLTALLLALTMLLSVPALAEEETEALPDQIDVSSDSVVVVDGVAINEEGEEIEGFEIPEELEEIVEILDAEIDDTVDPQALEINEKLPDNVINILLIGIDSRSTEIEEHTQHGDVQIIVSINKDDGSIKLTSVLRDLYVTIPGYKSKNRINVAYQRGGGQLAMRTINHNFDMNIEKYIVINFYGLASIIDSLGGIDIELTKQEASAINAYIKKHPPRYDNQDDDYERVPLEKVKGVQHLDGIQAVMYARLRSIDNDFARSARQRHLLELLLKKVTEGGMDFDKLFKLLETCLPYAKTNMSLSDMGSLAMTVLQSGLLERAANGESLLEQNRIPMDDTWKYDTTSGGASVVVFRTTKRHTENIQKLHEFVYGEYYPAD